jgi:Fic family protein
MIEGERLMDGLDPRKLDEAYKPFPPFEAWMKTVQVDSERWERYAWPISELRTIPPLLLQRAREIASRAAAIDTGAIEGLYEVDRGFTMSVAMETATWQAAVESKGSEFRTLFEAQLKAYDYVLDFATGNRPIAETWIRTLHEEICGSQDTYQVMTEVGPQTQPLPKGQYKKHPNHVRRQDGSTHAYCPVDLTPYEMQRFVSELESESFLSAHAVMQAAYSHFAFVSVHPFADGNGRVARALASAYSYRAQSVPLVILLEHRADYFGALKEADADNWQILVDFVFSRFVDSIQLVKESIAAASVARPQEILARISKLYVTAGGYPVQEVDRAGTLLAESLSNEFQALATSMPSERVLFGQAIGETVLPTYPEGYRRPAAGAVILNLQARAVTPADSAISRQYVFALPTGGNPEEDILVFCVQTREQLRFPLGSCIPSISAMTVMRLRMLAEKIRGELLTDLERVAAVSLKEKGY